MNEPAAAADVIAAELRAAGSPERAVRERAYLKSDLDFFGVPVPVTRAAIRSWCRARPALGHDELVPVAAALWQRPVFECRMAAEMLLELNPGLLSVCDELTSFPASRPVRSVVWAMPRRRWRGGSR